MFSHVGKSKVEKIELDRNILLSSNLKSDINKSQEISTQKHINSNFILNFINFYCDSVSETLSLTTKLGNFDNFESLLISSGLEESPNKFGHHCLKKDNVLYAVFIVHNKLSINRIIMKVYAPDYSKLGVFIHILKNNVACDTTIQLATSRWIFIYYISDLFFNFNMGDRREECCFKEKCYRK